MHTGRYPHSTGVLGLTHGSFGWDLGSAEVHLATVLGRAGYHTAVIGVHHESIRPERCGFEEIQATTAPGRLIAERCAAFFRRQADSTAPFYLQVGFFEPHRPFDFGGAEAEAAGDVFVPPYLHPDGEGRKEFAALQGAIRQLDAAVGHLLAALDQEGLAENTLVVFAADHGLPFPRAKCTLYDPGLEAALLVRWPRRGWRGGQVIEELVSNVDYFPTILEAAGLPPAPVVHGRSLCRRLDAGREPPRDEIFAEMTYHQYYDPMRCVRTTRHKLICNLSSAPAFMNPTQTYRPITRTVAPDTALHPDIELYDLAADPRERLNLALAPESAGLRDELLSRLVAWMRATDDPVLHGVPPCPQHQRVLGKLAQAGQRG